MTDKGYSRASPSPRVDRTRWLADEMLGRLARYLRFVGCDVEYVRGLDDGAIVTRAVAEDRVLLTRDRSLAVRAPRAIRIQGLAIGDQWRELRAAWPDLPVEVRFDRCSECNGRLGPYVLGATPDREDGVPKDRVARGLPLFACERCGHLYWEGSHTDRIRAQLKSWTEAGPP